jgi:hypothetical protein
LLSANIVKIAIFTVLSTHFLSANSFLERKRARNPYFIRELDCVRKATISAKTAFSNKCLLFASDNS